MRCPKCNSNTIFMRNAVPRFETHVTRVVKGKIREVYTREPRFYICCQCGCRFNVKWEGGGYGEKNGANWKVLDSSLYAR